MKSRRSRTESGGNNRKEFLQTLGAATVGAAGLDAAVITKAFGATAVARELPRAQITAPLQTAIAKSEHPELFPMINRSLARLGLHPAEDVARVYEVTNVATGAPKTLTIVPYHPANRSQNIVGGVGISEGQPASAVSVQLNGTTVQSITTHDVLFGKLVVRTFTPAQLASGGVERFVERNLPRDRSVTPSITVQDAAGLGVRTFRSLLAAEQAQGVYSPAQVRGFLGNTQTVGLIAQLQYARHRGLTMSPGNACCCCSCCCWGCCSCSSAVSTRYVSEKYRSKAAARYLRA
jgi:hypothetical protein